eukprot:320220_1
MSQYQRNCRQYQSKPYFHQKYSNDPTCAPKHPSNAHSNSDDENKSANHHRHKKTPYIPKHQKSEIYNQNGHIMYLTSSSTPQARFSLPQFIKTITNRSQTGLIKAKLLAVNMTPSNNKSIVLKLTVSSPHTFQKLYQTHTDIQQIIKVNNIQFTPHIPDMYHTQSHCNSLKLCIKPFSANQDCAIWSSSYNGYSHPISYYVDKQLFIYLGECDGTEYKITVHPKDIYFVEYRKDGYNEYNIYKNESHLKLRLLGPCSISKLRITMEDRHHPLPILPCNGMNCSSNTWRNVNGKIFKPCGNEHINTNKSTQHHIFDKSIAYGVQSLDVLPKVMGKSSILFLSFDVEPTELLHWIQTNDCKPTHYEYFEISSELVSPPNYLTERNEYKDNLLALRGTSMMDDTLIDYVDCLMNAARVGDEYVIHEHEMTASFIEILMHNKYKRRFINNRYEENKHHTLIRNALQYYACLTVKDLKQKILSNAHHVSSIFKSDAILRFLIRDTEQRILNANKELMITTPFSQRNTIEIRRALVTPTRCIMCPAEHCPLSSIFKWILHHKYQNHLLFVTFVSETLDAMPIQCVPNQMNDGRITICNRTYHYLFSTPSLLRHATLCFFESAAKYANGKHVGSMQVMNRICRTASTSNAIMTHWASRRFLPSIIAIKESCIGSFVECDDDGLYTDGVGMASTQFMCTVVYKQLLAQQSCKLSQYRLNIDEYCSGVCPTLIRFAYKGYFGVLVMNPNPNKNNIIFRTSQKKYRFSQRDDMEIYEFSHWKPAYLKPNSILVLQALGIDVKVFYDLIRTRIILLTHARCDSACAKYLLCNMECVDIPSIVGSDGSGYSFKQSVWMKAVHCALLEDNEVVFSKFIQIMIEMEWKLLRSQYKVMLSYKDGALLYGCIDELQILNKNEVFIQTYDKELQKWEIWNGSKVLIYNETHIYYPTDVIVMDLSMKKHHNELRYIYRNVVVFPHPSKYKDCGHMPPIFFECGGATLNGDTQFICIRNKDMIPKVNINAEYIAYPQRKNHNKEKKIQPSEYAYETLSVNDSIDVNSLKFLWLCQADMNGAKCKACRDISIEIYKANKYHLLHMQLNDITAYQCDVFPEWIQTLKVGCKINELQKCNYKTQSVMKHIADMIARKYKNYNASSPISLGYTSSGSSPICDRDLVNELQSKGYDDSDLTIVDLKRAFEFDLYVRCKQYGCVHECELLTCKLLDLSTTKEISAMDWNEYQLLRLRRKQFVCGRDESFALQTILYKMSHDMFGHFRRKLKNNESTDSRHLYTKSLVIYDLIYQQKLDSGKQNYPFPSLLFAWILADYWIDIKLWCKEQKRLHPTAVLRNTKYENHQMNDQKQNNKDSSAKHTCVLSS